MMVVSEMTAAGFEVAGQRLLLGRREHGIDLLLDVGLRGAVLLRRGEDRAQLRALGFGQIEVGKRLQRLLALRSDAGIRLRRGNGEALNS